MIVRWPTTIGLLTRSSGHNAGSLRYAQLALPRKRAVSGLRPVRLRLARQGASRRLSRLASKLGGGACGRGADQRVKACRQASPELGLRAKRLHAPPRRVRSCTRLLRNSERRPQARPGGVGSIRRLIHRQVEVTGLNTALHPRVEQVHAGVEVLRQRGTFALTGGAGERRLSVAFEQLDE